MEEMREKIKGDKNGEEPERCLSCIQFLKEYFKAKTGRASVFTAVQLHAFSFWKCHFWKYESQRIAREYFCLLYIWEIVITPVK